MWSGAIGAIPVGYVICDGNNGTPDLRDRFVVGAGTTYNPDDTGGNAVHTHTFTGDGHAHDFEGGTAVESQDPAAPADTSSTAVTGTTDNGSTLPPYYSLAYIMKT